MAWKPDYITVDQLKNYKQIGDTEDDVSLALAVTSASRAVDICTGRQFGQVDSPEVRTFTAVYDRHRGIYVCPIDDLATVTGTLLDGEELDEANLFPRNAVKKGKVWTELQVESVGDHDITGPWGWPAFPQTVVHATLLQASRFAARRDSPYGVAGAPNVTGAGDLRLLSKVDPDVAVMLKDYTRWWAAA